MNCTRPPSRVPLRCATAIAVGEISVAMTRAFGRSSASAIATMPLPVQASTNVRGSVVEGKSSSAASTMSSVSGRGISTAGETSNVMSQKSRRPVM